MVANISNSRNITILQTKLTTITIYVTTEELSNKMSNYRNYKSYCKNNRTPKKFN